VTQGKLFIKSGVFVCRTTVYFWSKEPKSILISQAKVVNIIVNIEGESVVVCW
jgi:hypothetical protein